MMIHNMKRSIAPSKVETSGTCGVGGAIDRSRLDPFLTRTE